MRLIMSTLLSMVKLFQWTIDNGKDNPLKSLVLLNI